MKSDYLRLECRIQRWNTIQPAVFLIRANHHVLPTAVYNKSTFESMDNVKGLRPRPLKTHAYNFNRIYDEGGNLIIDKRATGGASANEFVRRIIRAAKPIDQKKYLEELDRIVWPSQKDSAYLMRSRAPVDKAAFFNVQYTDRAPERSNMRIDSMAYGSGSIDKGQDASARKQLLRQLTDLISKMDAEDLEALLKLARTLEEG